MQESVAARVHAILVDVLMLEDPTRVQPDAHVVRDLGAESINLAELVVAIENEFGIDVPGEAMGQVGTVSSLCAMVEGALGQKTPG
ncbi:MAG: acyl carrier protein [Candidatus Sericytochromatia bacterium]|nr:acyl carrier protein [Candidatus Tanganyikabacteria bacterium]